MSGKLFESKTNPENILTDLNFVRKSINKTKYGYYFVNKKHRVYYFTQNGFRLFTVSRFGIKGIRVPDEAYYFEKQKQIVIVEKKFQSIEGTVENKLWASPTFKKEYEIMFKDFKILYVLCLNDFYKQKFAQSEKYAILKKILDSKNIKVLYGDSKDYFDSISSLLSEFL